MWQHIIDGDSVEYSLRIYDIDDFSTPLHSFDDVNPSNDFAFSYDGRWFFYSDEEKEEVKIYNTKNFCLVDSFQVPGRIVYMDSTKEGLDLIFHPMPDISIIAELLNKKDLKPRLFRITISENGKFFPRLFSIPEYNVKTIEDFGYFESEIFSKIAISRIVENIHQITCAKADKLNINYDVIEFDTQNFDKAIGKMSISCFDNFYITLSKLYTRDIIKENMILKHTNNRTMFSSRNYISGWISIPGMNVNNNTIYDNTYDRLLGQSIRNIYTAIDLSTRSRIDEARFSIGLLIKDCTFNHCHFDNHLTHNKIIYNGGIIK